MQKRGFALLFTFLLVFSVSFVVAQKDNADASSINLDDLESEYADAQLPSAGLTPDSPFYFLDGLFSRNSRGEKIAELKQMIEEGKIDDAREALKQYKKQVEKFKDDPDPAKREEARKGAAAIHKALKKIEPSLSESEKKEFFDDVIKEEEEVVTTMEISSKIKQLCEQLAELDPGAYYDTCRTDDNSADWQKKLDKDLTNEQRQEAKKFGEIMSQCFETSGQNCRCDEIPFKEFADACSVAAPLATACDIEGDERACDKLDNLEMPELPKNLQSVFNNLDSAMGSKYDMHMPPECVKAGVTTPKECGKIMIETNAPEECKQALLDANVQNEREGREICDKIMMELHAPDCAEKGITNPDECARFMDRFRGEDHRGPGPRIDFDCKEIEEATKRLECYDKASSQATSYKGFGNDYQGNCMTESDWKKKKQECREMYGEHAGDEPVMGDSGEGYECAVDAKCVDFSQGKMGFKEIKKKEKECADSCIDGRWDFSYGDCKCYEDNSEDHYQGDGNCDDCERECDERPGQRLKKTDCVNGKCECDYENDDFEDDFNEHEGNFDDEFEDGGGPPPGSGGNEGGSGSGGNGGGSESGSDGNSEGSGDSGGGSGSGGNGGGSESGSGDGEPPQESPPTDGSEGDGGGITGNAFLNWYYG